MATVLRTPLSRPPPSHIRNATAVIYSQVFCVSFGHRRSFRINSLRVCNRLRFEKFVPFASNGESIETEVLQESELEENSDNGVGVKDDVEEGASDGATNSEEETPASAVTESLLSYKEALASNDESKVAELEAIIKSIEDDKINLERQVLILSEELSTERNRVLRIGADFDNFRKRTESERLSLVTNAQGELVENLLPVLDNFERAKAQIKVETEGEEKISNSYQSIYKQFVEILNSLGVVPVETTGKPFDPMLHEAIMREDSEEYEDGIVLQEFRKGFKLGDRLLRPSMVKVSAGPGPAKPEPVESPSEEPEVVSETDEESSSGGGGGEEEPTEKL